MLLSTITHYTSNEECVATYISAVVLQPTSMYGALGAFPRHKVQPIKET